MAPLFGMHGRLTAQAGQGDALAALLLEAADVLAGRDACLLYLVSRSPDDPDTVWVTEAWTDREAHDASLQDERVQALIARARPIIAAPPEATELVPIGGKGL